MGVAGPWRAQLGRGDNKTKLGTGVGVAAPAATRPELHRGLKARSQRLTLLVKE